MFSIMGVFTFLSSLLFSNGVESQIMENLYQPKSFGLKQSQDHSKIEEDEDAPKVTYMTTWTHFKVNMIDMLPESLHKCLFRDKDAYFIYQSRRAF